MTVDTVLQRIKYLLGKRGWSLYKLADVCNLPHTSLYTMMQRHTMPKLDTLDIICKGLGITLSDFFVDLSGSDKTEHGNISTQEKMLLEITQSLTDRQLELILTYAKGLYDDSHE